MQLATTPHSISLLAPPSSRLSSSSLSPRRFFTSPRRLCSLSYSSQSSILPDSGDDFVVGDCLVYEDGVFEDSYLEEEVATPISRDPNQERKKNRRGVAKRLVEQPEIQPENLVPEEWRDIQAEVNLTKKDKRKIAQELEFGVKVEKKRQGLIPLRSVDLNEYTTYKEAKLAQLKPMTLDKPSNFSDDGASSSDGKSGVTSSGERVAPKNPRWAVYGKGFDHVTKFFNSDKYDPSGKKSEEPRKLLSKEEKFMLNSRTPDLAVATSKKWLPLHTLAASGEFYLVDSLLKHNLDINATDVGGLTALHRAIIGKKQAITNYLLRESANPFVIDYEGATLMHYAVQTASAPTIKLLLLYNADINAQDKDGWTPLHVAVQARRSDIVKLLLLKKADVEVKNKDGLTPLGLCLHLGRETRTYEMIKILKEFPGSRHKKPVKDGSYIE